MSTKEEKRVVCSMQYIRDTYKVPAKRGGRVRWNNCEGTIYGTDMARLKVRLDAGACQVVLHPTDARLEYLTEVSHEQ